jgi:hypothetical protein
MNEENSIPEHNSNLTNQNETEWQAPPLPEEIAKTDEPPQMSEVATLGNIFFEPGRTFEDLRRKPRFILAALIIIVITTLFQFLFIQKLGYERILRERLESNARVQQMPAEQKQQIIDQQTQPVFKAISYIFLLVFLLASFFLGGLFYWLGGNAMGGTAKYLQGVSVWVYSWLPPTLLMMLANILILFLKSADDIDIGASQRGLVQANPSFFIDGKQSPVLATLLSTFDLFYIWGLILAAIGLQKVVKLSAASAWTVVLIVALIGITVRIVMALMFGNPM